MPIYTCVMIALTIGLALIGVLFLCGIHGWFYLFNRSGHKDDKAYSRFLGQAMMLLACSTLVSGLVFVGLGTAPAVVLLVVGVVGSFAFTIKNSSKHY